MNNKHLKYIPDLVAELNRNPIVNSYQGELSNPSSQQQKRQNSLSNYVTNNSNKRTSNPLQMSMSTQNTQDFNFPQSSINNNTISGSVNAPGVSSQRLSNNPMIRNNVRRSLMQHQKGQYNGHPVTTGTMKTPTPSAYDVPSSPNINPMSSISANNNSDLSDSNALDQNQQNKSQARLLQADTEHMQSSDFSSGTKEMASLMNPIMQGQQSSQQETLHEVSPPEQQQNNQQHFQRTMSDEEQQLASKLKDTYKNIVNFEEVVQKNCIEISIKINTTASTSIQSYRDSPMVNPQLSSSVNSSSSVSSSSKASDLLNDLWTVYHHNITLLDNYYDFLVTALKPTSNQTQFKTGKNIVDLYKIPRRMWVYGIVGFLEVLKNIMSIFQDHEICLCFIAYCFNIISNLTDPVLEMEGWWSEKLGDLSRMAIALYSSRFIDWKISAEYWYSVSMKTLYGHGKIYYHMCTVQQDNLDALVNIGKSVVCRDPFVPTQQYLRLVVENICTQRNILSLLELPTIDFIKIHKVLLSIHTNYSNSENISGNADNIHDTQLQYGIDLVTRYGLTFGSDSNGYNFFTGEIYTPHGTTSMNDPHHPYYLQQQQQQQQTGATNSVEKMNFWFNKGSLFAIANINHLIGFGDAKNPFAKIFQLPEVLKERKDKKDRKRKSRGSQSHIDEPINAAAISSGVDGQTITASDLSADNWFYCLKFINKSVLELSVRILNHYLIGPKQASTCHVIVWLYFLISIGEATNKFPNSKPMFMWIFRKLFPWESIINYLNSLLSVTKDNSKLNEMCRFYLLNHPNYVDYFNNNEFLPEVWKCWGTVWFDFISTKNDYNDISLAGVQNYNLFDLPICGTSPVVDLIHSYEQKTRLQLEFDNDERIVRIILLARFIADNYEFGLIRSNEGFKFDEGIYLNADVFDSSTRESGAYAYIEEFLLSDKRFVQNNFLQQITRENLVNRSTFENISALERDDIWFKLSDLNSSGDAGSHQLNYGDINENDLENYGNSKFNDSQIDYDSNSNRYQQLDDQVFQHRQMNVGDDLYNEIFMNNSESLPTRGGRFSVEGDLGDGIDSNLTYVTLDTNIWLKHCGRVFKCVRNSVLKVLIPLIVFQELRSLRKSAEATIADAATRSVIIIRELYFTGEILPLRFDGSVASDINETTEFENNSNWRTNVEETILISVNKHDEMSKKLMKGLNLTVNGPSNETVVLDSTASKAFNYCILITDDRNMRLRAKVIGLTSFQSKWLFCQLEDIFPYKCID